MVRQITGRVLACVAWSAVVVYVHKIQAIDLPSNVHTLVGVALGLLLVFRTNASYDRFWEGRRLIGSILDNARDLGRQTAAFLPVEHRRETIDLVVAQYATIRRYLRGEKEWPELASR